MHNIRKYYKRIIMTMVILAGVVCAIYFFAVGQRMDAILSLLTVVAPASIWHSDYMESKKQHKQLISLQKKVDDYGMEIIEHPEWGYLITDPTEQYLIFGIRHDGSVDWSKGVPGPIRDSIDELRKRIEKLEKQKL